MRKKSKLVYGVGINDSETPVYKYVNGKKVICPFYERWKGMLKRCYSEKYQEKQPTYIGCSVCEEWLTFSNFRDWMQSQDWECKDLDKDLLIEGNKVYSPHNCIFVSHKINSFTTDRASSRGDCLIGVHWHNRDGKFQSRCNNPFTGKYEYLGDFTSELAAHKAWKRRKHELALMLAEEVEYPRLKKALITRYV